MGEKPKVEVEDCHQISILDIKRAGFFEVVGGQVRGIVLKCTIDDREYKYEYRLVTTKCYFGGSRHWFKCHCGRRVYKLYIPPGEDVFGCRTCHNLTYRSRKRENTVRIMKSMLRIMQ